ncbi:uncharacterized protein [Mobula birostris]|uniref:uncharacterized protein isoform X2 n=1 Tax=Mobula birostris TaxID=1983395 RepID=UPI003B280608
MTTSPLGMKGGCSLFGVGTDKSEERGRCNGRRESKCGSHGDDLYLRQIDEMGITCLSYNPSALYSRTFASGEDDFCRPPGKHSASRDRRPHCQRPSRIDSDHSCGGVADRGATGAWKSEGGRVRKSAAAKMCGTVPFPRENSSWLNSATQDKLREFPCSGRRQSRNKSVIPRFHKQGSEGPDPIGLGPFVREDTWWRSRLLRGAYPQSGAEPRLRTERCTRKTDDVYVYEVDDAGTLSLFYKQRPSSCGVSDSDDNLCGKKGHPKDTCQHLSCKWCKSQPVPGRTRCSLCSDDTSSLMSLKQGDCHTSTFRTNGGSTPIIYSLPQWPRHLLLQNSGAQATTAVYKD